MTQQDASNRTTVDSGALKLALNVLRRAGKIEVADALEETAIRGQSALAEQDDEAVAYGIPHDENNNTFAYELLAMELAAEEHDDIHQLVYEGYPPEPWGEVWQRYEADAKKMIERVQKHTRPAPKTYTEHDIDVAIGVVEWDKLNLFATAEAVKQIVMRFAGSHVTMEPKRLSEDEVEDLFRASGGNANTFANALMDKMTGGGE